MRIGLLLTLLPLIFLLACKNHRPAESTFFLEPGPVSVATSADQGSGSHRITDLWLYVNGQFSGCYPAGNRMPVMSRGQASTIQIFAGIRNNGISTTRIPWLFYNIVRIDTFLANGQTFSVPLTFRYQSAVTFTWVENCNGDLGLTVRPSPVSEATVELLPLSESFEGRSVGMELLPGQSVAQLESSDQYRLPRFNTNVYLELNYKCNSPMLVGVIDQFDQARGALVLNPQPEWNKIYIQLTEPVSREPVSDRFRIFCRLDRQEEANPGFAIDNIKLLYLP